MPTIKSFHILTVTTAAQAQQWLALPARLHAAEPAYIGPLENEVEAVFDPAKNPHLQGANAGQAIRWLLLDADGVPQGRVAAFVDPRTPDAANPDLPTGGLGFFECVNDAAGAALLFDAARRWLAARGMQAMDGPINFGERDRFWGVLIDGFQWEPNYGMFWHPAYYRALFEGYGFQLYFKQFTCHRDVSEPLHPTFKLKAEAYAAGADFRFLHASAANLPKLAADFRHVYNLAWAKHAGVATMTEENARALVQQLAPVLDETLLWFAYHRDEPVAFFISLPELNQIFKHVGGRLNLLGKLRFLVARWRYRRLPNKKVLGIIYGVIPEHQGKGVDLVMTYHARQKMLDGGYTDIEMNWIGDFNPRMMATMRGMNARIRKTHATYRFLFDRNREFVRNAAMR